jgi:hypothetical protein
LRSTNKTQRRTGHSGNATPCGVITKPPIQNVEKGAFWFVAQAFWSQSAPGKAIPEQTFLWLSVYGRNYIRIDKILKNLFKRQRHTKVLIKQIWKPWHAFDCATQQIHECLFIFILFFFYEWWSLYGKTNTFIMYHNYIHISWIQ